MTTTLSDSSLTTPSLAGLKTALVEPALVVGAVAFWLVALPFVAVWLLGVKVWDTLKGIAAGTDGRPNPLILRRGLAKSTLTERRSTQTA